MLAQTEKSDARLHMKKCAAPDLFILTCRRIFLPQSIRLCPNLTGLEPKDEIALRGQVSLYPARFGNSQNTRIPTLRLLRKSGRGVQSDAGAHRDARVKVNHMFIDHPYTPG